MCFSAEASFSASAVLLVIGISAIRKSTSFPQRFFSCLPLIFSAQQFVEGFVWLSFTNPHFESWRQPAAYAFLIFAQVVWPSFVPFAAMFLERSKQNRGILKALCLSGLAISSVLLYHLIAYPVEANAEGHHIRYNIYYPTSVSHAGLFYSIPTVFPLIMSSMKRVRLLGAVIFVSYLITEIFYDYYLTSVWCFFSAVISLIIFSAIVQLNSHKTVGQVLKTV